MQTDSPVFRLRFCLQLTEETLKTSNMFVSETTNSVSIIMMKWNPLKLYVSVQHNVTTRIKSHLNDPFRLNCLRKPACLVRISETTYFIVLLHISDVMVHSSLLVCFRNFTIFMNIDRRLKHRTDYHVTSISRLRNSIITIFKDVFYLKTSMMDVDQLTLYILENALIMGSVKQ